MLYILMLSGVPESVGVLNYGKADKIEEISHFHNLIHFQSCQPSKRGISGSTSNCFPFFSIFDQNIYMYILALFSI
jgi:hypothetical protein